MEIACLLSRQQHSLLCPVQHIECSLVEVDLKAHWLVYGMFTLYKNDVWLYAAVAVQTCTM